MTERLSAIAGEAAQLADAGRDLESAAAYSVAADLLEETGWAMHARLARIAARKMLVVHWAKTRFPDDRIDQWCVSSVRAPQYRHKRTGESWLFRVVRRGPDVYARVDRRNRIREVERA